MPEDIHTSLWARVCAVIESSALAATREIYDELVCIPGIVGECIKSNEANLLLEVGDARWDSIAYIGHATRMQQVYAHLISENNGGRKGTVGLNDISIIAMARTLRLPVISMELPKAHQTDKKATIPDICRLEGVPHMTFNDFLRAYGIKL